MKFRSSVAILMQVWTVLQISIEDLSDVKSRPGIKTQLALAAIRFHCRAFISEPLIFSKIEGWNRKTRIFRLVTTYLRSAF